MSNNIEYVHNGCHWSKPQQLPPHKTNMAWNKRDWFLDNNNDMRGNKDNDSIPEQPLSKKREGKMLGQSVRSKIKQIGGHQYHQTLEKGSLLMT